MNGKMIESSPGDHDRGDGRRHANSGIDVEGENAVHFFYGGFDEVDRHLM